MNLIDKYVTEVGKHLPRRQRVDIEAEIRSTLEEMLEERKQAMGRDDDALVVELLRDYGEPRRVAESYAGPRYLIGPRVYPIFELVTKIVLAVLLAVALARLGISLSRSSLAGTPLEDSAQLFTTLGNLVPTLVLTIVIIVSSIEVAQMVYHLVKSRPSSTYPAIK